MQTHLLTFLVRPIFPLSRLASVRIRLAIYFLSFVAIWASAAVVSMAHAQAERAEQRFEQTAAGHDAFMEASIKYRTVRLLISNAAALGLPTEIATASLAEISGLLATGSYREAGSAADTQVTALQAALSARQAENAKKGSVTGMVSGGAGPLPGVIVSVISAERTLGSSTTGPDGKYGFTFEADTYTVKAELAGYEASTATVDVVAQAVVTHDIVLVPIPVATPTPTPVPTSKPTSKPVTTPKPTATPKPAATAASTSDSTAYSTYARTTVKTDSGSFVADIMTFDLASGHIGVVADSANDDDCTNECPVKSVKSFMDRAGGFAAINGTYFCPTAYADCAGKTNSFYWKFLNSRLGKMLNPNNLLGEQDPFYAFDANGRATFWGRWIDYKDSGVTASAGISCKPVLVSGGNYVVRESDLDSNQKTAKVGRGALGLKGQTFYVVTVQGATVYDLGRVMQALGVDNAMNIDGGGSTAMLYKGAYKRGPGRDVPNALVFVEK